MQPQRTTSTDLDCLSLAAIDHVVHMHDAVQRNLWITYTYHRLELALAERLGGDEDLPTFDAACLQDLAALVDEG